MGLIENILGTPSEHGAEKKEQEVVKTPEFDVTQYAKKLAVMVGVVAAAAASALKLFKVDQVTPGIVIGAFGLAAAALIGASLVMAIDVAARAYLAGRGAAEKEKEQAAKVGAHEGESNLVPAPPGTVAWIEDKAKPRPVLAIKEGPAGPAYLVAAKPRQGNSGTQPGEGAPKWITGDAVRSVSLGENWP